MSRTTSARMDVKDLSGKAAVVTGAGSGIGRSLAVLLAGRGAAVHGVDRDDDGARAVVQAIVESGGTAFGHTVDVADADAVLERV